MSERTGRYSIFDLHAYFMDDMEIKYPLQIIFPVIQSPENHAEVDTPCPGQRNMQTRQRTVMDFIILP